MTLDIDEALATTPAEPATSVSTGPGRRCGHPRDRRERTDDGHRCTSCGHVIPAATAKRGKQSRNYGNRAELAVARRYGGTKIGHAGGPVDVRGRDWNTQVKTHRRKPPVEWTKAFSGMAVSAERLPRLLLRFVMGPGVPPVDYIVVPAAAWLDWFGKDEDDSDGHGRDEVRR